MNGYEKEFAQLLELRRKAGEIWKWTFDEHKLRAGHDCWYSPDFYVLAADGHITYYEVKGFWREDARVKIKAIAFRHPEYDFIAVTKKKKRDGGGWVYETIKVA